MRVAGNSGFVAFAEQRSVAAKAAARDGAEPAPAEAAAPADPADTAAEPEPVLGTGDPRKLTDQQKAELVELQHRDAEVRAHEAAHAAAAGSLGGGATFEYTTGPDGRSYAIGGEVPVRISSGRTPEETLRNAAQVRAAALAPAEPSGQDRAVAVEAAAMEAAARAELAARSAALAREMAAPERGPESRADQPAADPRVRETASTTEAVEEHLARSPDEVIRQLESEQRVSRAGWRHLHLEASCGSCGMAAAAYR